MTTKTYKEEENIKKVAATYARVSTEDQANNGLSIDAQEKTCFEHATREGYSVLEKIRDEGKSGGNLNRPGIKRLKELVEKGFINAVFMVHGDRLARSTTDHIEMMDFFEKHNVSVCFTYQPGLDRGTAFGYTMDTMLAVMSENFRRVISEKTVASLTEKAKEGWLPGVAPIGYLNVDNPNFHKGEISKKMVIQDPVMGPLITEAFKLFATGSYNGAELDDLMYEKGLRTKRGNKVSYSIFYDMLSNPFYAGELHWRDVHLTNAKHQPLIDKETFKKVRSVLDAHINSDNRRRKHWFLLRGILYCARHRGSRYTAEWHIKKDGSRFAYYHCSERHGCQGQYSPKEELEDKISELLKDMSFSKELIDMVIKKAKASIEADRQRYGANVDRLTAQRNSLLTRKTIAENKLLGDVLSDDDFIRIRQEIESGVSSIDAQLAKLELNQGENIDVVREILKLIRNIQNSYEKAAPEIKHQYLAMFFKAIYVSNGEIQEVVYADLINELMRLKHLFKPNKGVIIPTKSRVIISHEVGA